MSDKFYGSGIPLASGFDLGAKKPLDSRLVVNTIAERDEHVTGNRAYVGLIVYVISEKKNYQFDGENWIDIHEGYATKEELQNIDVTDQIAGKADKEHTHEQYLTEHQDISQLATKGEVKDVSDLVDYHDSTLFGEDGMYTTLDNVKGDVSYLNYIVNPEYYDSWKSFMGNAKSIPESLLELWMKDYDTQIANKADKEHTHSEYATKAELENIDVSDQLATKADKEHTHENYASKDEFDTLNEIILDLLSRIEALESGGVVTPQQTYILDKDGNRILDSDGNAIYFL